MSEITIYHNGECSKCRGALEILQEKAIPHQVRWYLADPLSRQELRVLLGKLGMKPSELVRKSEDIYQDMYSSKDPGEEGWLDVLIEYPVLIQRPIVERDDKAIIARPPEKIFEFI
jgi:arsenate reductase